MKQHLDRKKLAKMKRKIFEPKDDGNFLTAFKVLEIPEESFLDVPHIEIISYKKAILDNIDGVLEYNPDIIKVSKGNTIICIYGTNLEFSSMKIQSIVVTGEITRIEFER